MRLALVIVSLLLALPVGAVTLPERGNVVFLGDSITWQNLYVRYVEAFSLRAFPERDLTVINRGVRGDTAGGALARVDADVVPHDPKLVVIMLGMNDGGFGPPSGVLLSRYLRDMERLVEALRARTDAQLLLMTPTCVEPIDDRHRTYNETLAVMSRELVALAAKLRVDVLDIHTRFAAELSSELMADPLHPGPDGHALVARWLLEELVPGGASTGVQHELDACAGKQGTPFSLSHGHRNALLPAALAAHNAHLFEVGDASCELELVVDGEVIGRFDPSHWQRGVDLNRLTTAPWVREAVRVDRLLQEKWRWFYARWDPKGVGVEAIEHVGGRRWSGSSEELRARADRELRRIGAELRAARSATPVTYPARLRPAPKVGAHPTRTD